VTVQTGWRLKLGLLCGAVLFALAAAEIGLRIAGISYPPPLRVGEKPRHPPFYVLNDPYRGWAGNPGAGSVWTGEGEHGEIRMNTAGFLDREWDREKPENTFRIALLGDSFAEAVYLRPEHRVSSRIGEALQGCRGLEDEQVEVMNFGVQGYGTFQQLMVLRHHVWSYQPDLVILVFYPGNDVRNNSRTLEHDHLRPYLVLEEGEWVEDVSFRGLNNRQRDRYAFSRVDWLPVWLVRGSRILQLIRNAEMQRLFRRYNEEYEQIHVGFYREPAPGSEWEQAWDTTDELIRRMRDEVMEKDAMFMLVNASDSYQVTPNLDQRNWFLETYNLPDLQYPIRHMTALGRQEGIPVFNVAPPLRAEAERSGRCLHGFENAVPCGGHWNVEGSRLAGQLIAEFICRELQSD
jgi:hypothetical protein